MNDRRPIEGFLGYTIDPAGSVQRGANVLSLAVHRGRRRVQLKLGEGRNTSRYVDDLVRVAFPDVPSIEASPAR